MILRAPSFLVRVQCLLVERRSKANIEHSKKRVSRRHRRVFKIGTRLASAFVTKVVSLGLYKFMSDNGVEWEALSRCTITHVEVSSSIYQYYTKVSIQRLNETIRRNVYTKRSE